MKTSGGGDISEKCKTHSPERNNSTIGPATEALTLSRRTRGWPPLSLWDKTNSQLPRPSPRQEGPGTGAGPLHLRRGSQQRPGWKQGPEGGESDSGSAKSTGWRVRAEHPRKSGPRQRTFPSRDPRGPSPPLQSRIPGTGPRRTHRSSLHAA